VISAELEVLIFFSPSPESNSSGSSDPLDTSLAMIYTFVTSHFRSKIRTCPNKSLIKKFWPSCIWMSETHHLYQDMSQNHPENDIYQMRQQSLDRLQWIASLWVYHPLLLLNMRIRSQSSIFLPSRTEIRFLPRSAGNIIA